MDASTVRLHTQQPYPLVEEMLACGNFEMVPPKYVREKGDGHFALNPVGTGPYRFVEWKKGDRLVLEANDQYWQGAPAVKTVVFRVIPETATQIAEILSGGVDIIRAIPPDQIPALQASPNVKVTTSKVLRVVYLSTDAAARASKTPLTDARVRRALNHAVNVDEIMQKVLGGLAVRTNGAGMNPLTFGFDGDVKPYPFDPERARRLLAEAGLPNGFEVTLNTYGGSVVSVDQVSQAVQGYLGRVGVRARIKHFEDVGQYLAQLRAGKLDGLILQSWGNNSVFDADALYYFFFKRGQPYDYGTTDEISVLIEEARSTLDLRNKHALRNAAIPLVTIVGFQFGRVLGGAIVTETVFAWPGVASLAVKAIRTYDYPVVQAAVVFLALIIVVVNLATDLAVGYLDPRIRPRDAGRARSPDRFRVDRTVI